MYGRHRSSSAALRGVSPTKTYVTSELQALIDSLSETLSNSPRPPTVGTFQVQCDDLRRIRQLLIDSTNPGQTRDGFRHVGGFDALLKTLHLVSGFYEPAYLSRDEKTEFFELLKAVLEVLSEALDEHAGNRRYFAKRVEGGGWRALEQALANTGVTNVSRDQDLSDTSGQEQLFGCLYSFALREEHICRIFRDVQKLVSAAESTGEDECLSRHDEPELHGSGEYNDEQDDKTISTLRARLQRFLNGNEILRHPEIVPIIFNFWQQLSVDDASSSQSQVLRVAILLALQDITEQSAYNRLAVHGSGVLSSILPIVFGSSGSTRERAVLWNLANTLAVLGFNKLEDARFLYSQAMHSEDAAQYMLESMKLSREPPSIQFDLSLHGYSSIELTDLGQSFPGPSFVPGYTLAAWICIDNFDESCHTTIFGAYDASQTCFLLLYLEKSSRQLILQTSITSPRPSVRFRSTVFEPGKWYHIALVHRRPKTTSSSRAALYVNGEFVEQVKCHYPSSPPPPSGSTESFASVSSTGHKHAAVQAFLGTPQDLASRLGRNVISSRWSLASFHLIQDALSDELVAVHQKLGPRYSGNYQDCLGSFQTYRASAELNLYNETLHPGKEERSDIVAAIRTKASNLLPESRILLSISPTAVLDDNDSNNVDESQLIKSLSKDAARNLHHHTRVRGNAIVINAAVPSINDALTQPHGIAILTGEPVVTVPQSLDDASWRIAGCAAVGLRMIEAAEENGAVALAVKILFESIEGNWRNSEVMEKENGFAVLAALLREKMGFGPKLLTHTAEGSDAVLKPVNQRAELAHELLDVILGFVGYNKTRPEESLIINPLAYRTLLVDFDTWRQASYDTQKLYYNQYIHFAQGSKYHHFNAKRLNRMRIVKRLLDALKGETFTVDLFDDFLEAFRVLFKCSVTGDTLRSVALFVTYALQDSRAFSTPRFKPTARRFTTNGGTTTPSSPMVGTPRSVSPGLGIGQENVLSRAEVGMRILDLYAAILCDPATPSEMHKFAKTVTNKWLLYLLAESEPRVIVASARILARLLVVHGSHYIKKFADKSGGFIILKQRLRVWWNLPAVWTICFAILFGVDVARIDFERDFNLQNLSAIFPSEGIDVKHPQMLPVLCAMLESGLRAVAKIQDAPMLAHMKGNNQPDLGQSPSSRPRHLRQRSMSLNGDFASRSTAVSSPRSITRSYTDGRTGSPQPQSERLVDQVELLTTVIHFLRDLHSKCSRYRDFTVHSNYVQELVFVLYPVIVSSDIVSAEAELQTRGSVLTFEGQDVVIKPPAKSPGQGPLVVRTANVDSPPSPTVPRATPLRRGSSFILLSSDRPGLSPSPAKFTSVMSPRKRAAVPHQASSSVVEGLIEVIVGVFLDQIFHRKDFPGFGLFLKVPPGFQEHQAYFESHMLLRAMSAISKHMQDHQELLHEPRVLTNLLRYIQHMSEAVFEGWFLNGAEPLLDFIGTLLEYLERPDIAQIKSVRLCVQIISMIRVVLLRVALLRLSELDEPERGQETVAFLNKMNYWQTILFSAENTDSYFLTLMCYMLYTKLVSSNQAVRLAAANFWRMLLVHKPAESLNILTHAASSGQKHLPSGLMKLLELDNETFLSWTDSHRAELDVLFFGGMTQTWEDFVATENRKTEDSARHRISKRRERLRQWQAEETAAENVWHRHEISTNHWRANVYSSERGKHQRALQDQQDNLTYTAYTSEKLNKVLRGPCGLLEDVAPLKWQLDQTEGRNRMRMRILPDRSHDQEDYQPKRKGSETPAKKGLKLNTNVKILSSKDTIEVTPSIASAVDVQGFEASKGQSVSDASSNYANAEDEYEIVDNPREDEEGFEDKNRKVMRSLQRGDQVQHVCNVSRIVGLEAREGLLILGKDYLYLLDNYFQRADGEIVGVWQAPPEERDPYLQMIAGRETSTRKPRPDPLEQTARHWRWSEAISISKRRFLFRDVAIEVFFADGRSYLLIAASSGARNELFAKLIGRAPHVNNASSSVQSEDSWRLESLRNPDEMPQTFGSKFANVFNSAPSNPATRRWIKGEISNFHYLMLINTMAGRTFNDLTQYPVFPWVLADYTSEELDLDDPRSFRDLSKPMGCQTPAREAEFRERYHTFAEMSDHNTPPFHYGTHYSSAMIVTSYLIRLQPFVKSYLLLQGGTFDHADRLFYSIEKAWLSASRDNMTDVRELTPEFFYLPEFLTNINGYNFGARQGTGEKIDDVKLPPWAKGDPHIFIAKHREALESPYVTKNLHQWIDLVFGFKQSGDAAIEATNVFHHLSYHGAKDLDNIEDPVERLATIGIIHNFGQTPHQVFQRPHVPREEAPRKYKRLDMAAESLTRLPFPLLESHERVASLLYSSKQERLLCSAALRLNIPPTYERYMEWGFADNSVRFYSADNRKLIGLFEHLHEGQISATLFIDSRTLITAGTDCTLAIWTVASGSKYVDLQDPRYLFGHRAPVTVLAASKTFSTFLSASTDGKVYLWDLNRSEFVRELECGASSGGVGGGGGRVGCARIHGTTGEVVVCCGARVLLFTLNGHLLLKQKVCDTNDAEDVVVACAFYEGVGNEWVQRDLLFTGHRRGVVKIWNKTLDKAGKWTLELVKRLSHVDGPHEEGSSYAPAITCILPMAQVVYTGDDSGRVCEWNCVSRG